MASQSKEKIPLSGLVIVMVLLGAAICLLREIPELAEGLRLLVFKGG